MPPRLSILSRASISVPIFPTTISPFLLPFLHGQQRASSVLSDLRDNPSALHKRIRRGRGPSSGKGKTSGRGHKGQKQHGKVPFKFNGGQTKDEVVSGTRGFTNTFSIDLKTLNLSKLASWISQGRIDPTRPITIRELQQSRCVSNVKDGVKLLASGKEDLKDPLNIVISRASASAIAAIEAAGGKVTTRYYTPFATMQIRRGKMDPVHSLQANIPEEKGLEKKRFLNRLPDPTSRKDIEYYRDPAHRGYLSHLVPEGHGPSLFFKTPGTGKTAIRRTARGKTAASENRIW